MTGNVPKNTNNCPGLKFVCTKSKMSLLFSVEGNIGAGKSTVLEILRKIAPDVITCPEPIDLWNKITTEEGVPMLEAFYADQKTYAFPFQMNVLISRFEQLHTTQRLYPNSPIIQERSFLGDFDTFVSTLISYGYFNQVQTQTYLKLFEHFKSQSPTPIFFFIDTPSKVCYDRIKARARSGEEEISLEYLHKLGESLSYLMAAFFERSYILDGTKPASILAQEILAIIRENTLN